MQLKCCVDKKLKKKPYFECFLSQCQSRLSSWFRTVFFVLFFVFVILPQRAHEIIENEIWSECSFIHSFANTTSSNVCHKTIHQDLILNSLLHVRSTHILVNTNIRCINVISTVLRLSNHFNMFSIYLQLHWQCLNADFNLTSQFRPSMRHVCLLLIDVYIHNSW